MKSAIAIVAFSQCSELEGTIALLEVAQEALDKNGRNLPAAIIDLALAHLLEEVGRPGIYSLEEVTTLQ